MDLELNWKEDDKQKELEAARKTTEEVEECKEMWRHRSISLLGHWETSIMIGLKISSLFTKKV
ncbi:hypothetical protein Lal_00044317 [Lupinus albus]|nr:hypothetical protein Lal_00044317 [Lupinus albus]